MAISKTVIKLTHTEALVKIVNDTTADASVTIDLDVDLKDPLDVLEGIPTAAISQLEFSTAESSYITITRNSVPVFVLTGSTVFDLAFGSDRTEAASDIVVTMNKGTVIMRVLKLTGFEPKFRPEQGITLP